MLLIVVVVEEVSVVCSHSMGIYKDMKSKMVNEEEQGQNLEVNAEGTTTVLVRSDRSYQ